MLTQYNKIIEKIKVASIQLLIYLAAVLLSIFTNEYSKLTNGEKNLSQLKKYNKRDLQREKVKKE